MFDGEKSVSNPPATAKLNEYFRKSILLAALNQMGKDAEQQKHLRDSIIESWLDKTNIDKKKPPEFAKIDFGFLSRF